MRDHFETFRVEAARVHERDGLPRFIEEEFRGFLDHLLAPHAFHGEWNYTIHPTGPA